MVGGSTSGGSSHRAWEGWRGTHRGLGEGGRGRGSAGEEALNGAYEGVQRRAGVVLAEVGRGEAADEAIDAEATHGLVAQAEACVWDAAHVEPPTADDMALVVDGEDTGPRGLLVRVRQAVNGLRGGWRAGRVHRDGAQKGGMACRVGDWDEPRQAVEVRRERRSSRAGRVNRGGQGERSRQAVNG